MNPKDIEQNLRDAGCGSDQIECFLELERKGKTDDELLFLKCHRKTLLEDMHICGRRIDCLDFLVSKIEKQRKAGTAK